MTVDWMLGQLRLQQPGLWLAISFLLSAVHWVSARWLPPRLHGRLRYARWILVPYAGLLFGGLSPRLLGLTDLDWLAGLGLGVGLIFAIWVLLILVRLTVARAGDPKLRPIGSSANPPLLTLGGLLQAGAQEAHWTFLRGAMWELMLGLPNPPELVSYWAIWVASALAAPGILLQHRHNVHRLTAAVILIATAILFFYTRNFWLCWLLHATAKPLLGLPQRNQTWQPALDDGTEAPGV